MTAANMPVSSDSGISELGLPEAREPAVHGSKLDGPCGAGASSPATSSGGETLREPSRPGGLQPESLAARLVPVPVRTLQPGDVTDDGRTVLRVTPEIGGRLHVRFEDDDTLWRMGRESVVWIRETAA